jgi:DNA replication and repair protein RecF
MVYLQRLAVNDFRSYEEVSLDLQPGVTSFIGANGHGKTNLMEAVGYLATLSSHRVAQDSPLVRSGAERAYVRGVIVDRDRQVLLEVEINPGRANRVRINQSPAPKARDAIGIAKSILFAPEDLALIKGDPSERRRFLDEILILRTPRYAGVIADYERALKQRNALLKSAGHSRRVDTSTLDVWDDHLLNYGAELVAARLSLLNALTPLIGSAYRDLAAGGDIWIEYKPSNATYNQEIQKDPRVDDVRTTMRQSMEGIRSQELDRGITLIGPHRDEITLGLNDHPAKGYASQGESWSFALALRLASYDLLRGDGEEPILILDDVFAELDVARRAHLVKIISDAEQVLITAAVAADIPDTIVDTRIRVEKGRVSHD